MSIVSVRALISALALALGAVACADTRIVPEDYSRACTQSSDCAYAYFGDACDACLTELVPVHVDELDVIRADTDAAVATCPPWSDHATVECAVPVPSTRPVCVDGSCIDDEDESAPCVFDDGVCRGSDE